MEEACAIDEQGYLKHADWQRMGDFDSVHDYYSYLKEMISDENIDRGKLKKKSTQIHDTRNDGAH